MFGLAVSPAGGLFVSYCAVVQGLGSGAIDRRVERLTPRPLPVGPGTMELVATPICLGAMAGAPF